MYQKSTTKEIKKALVSHFNHPFSVRQDRGTAAHWISISWTDGPDDKAVRSFCFKFNDSSRDDIQTDLWCGSQYTSEHRETSLAAFQWAVKKIEEEWGVKIKVTIIDSWRADGSQTGYVDRDDDVLVDKDGNRHASQLINSLLYETDFRHLKI